MNYKKIYNSLLESRKINFSEEVGEMHHIVPKCLGGDDNIDNLVKLTFREHLLAHRLLSKIYPSHPGLNYAVVLLSKGNFGNRKLHPKGMKGKTQSKKARELVSEYMKLNNPNKNKSPWDIPSSNESSKKIWENADYYYEKWIEMGKPSYYKLTSNLNEKWKSSHQNMVMKFKCGWIPNEDVQWTTWRSENAV